MATASRRLVFFVLFVFLVLGAQSPPVRAQSDARDIRILLLYSHDPKTPGAVAFAREFHGVLKREWPSEAQVYEETLDVDRVGNRDNWPLFASYLASKYRGVRFDAVVAEGSVALQFAADKLTAAHPGMPIVYGIAFEPVVDFSSLPSNVTGRRLPLPYAETFRLAHRLQPGAKRVFVIAGAGALDSVLCEHAVHDITPLLHGVKLEVLRNWSYSSLLQSLRELPKESFVIMASIRKDWRGQSFSAGDLVPSITRASAVPVYGIARNWVGDGIVGGQTWQFAAEGERTGKLLLRVLRQPRGERLPPAAVAVNPIVVDWRQLQQWGLSEARLPAGTEVLFRATSPWKRYRSLILLILGLTTAQSALIGLLLLERRRRRRAQQSVEAQVAYERMLGALKLDAIQHVPDAEPRALEYALAHIGRYARATSATLVVHPEHPGQPPASFRWNGPSAPSPSSARAGIDTMPEVEIPLVSETSLVGVLTLRGLTSDGGPGSPERLRLQTAAEVIASTLARARASRALAESRGHVAHLGRIATMGQLGAVVSHELRQPLTSIRLNAQAGRRMLEKAPSDLDEISALLRDIVDDTTQAADLIEHVRMLLRRQRGESVSVSLNDICRNAAKLLHRAAQGSKVAVDVALADELPTVRGDAVQLQQVVLNLALNAIESAATSSDERRVVLRTTRHAGGVEVEVSDSGPGLPPQVQEHLFESYFSTKKSGLGLGLAIVHQIVDAHYGQVHAENRPSGGALFRVTLPTAPVADAPSGAARSDARTENAVSV